MLTNVMSNIFASIRFYKESHLKNIFEHVINNFNSGPFNINADQTKWQVNVTSQKVQDTHEYQDIILDFKLNDGCANECAVGIELELNDWSRDNYVIMPSAVYAGNRFESRCLNYPPLLQDIKDIGIDVDTIITDVPRLNISDGQSRVQLLTRDLATPAIGIYFPKYSKGLWLLTDQNTAVGDSGLFLEESTDRKNCKISIVAPGVREDTRYRYNMMQMPSEDCGVNFKAGDKVTLRFKSYLFDCNDIPCLFEKFVNIRKDISGEINLKCCIPFSAAWSIQEDKYNRQNWNKKGFYNVGINADDNPVVYNLWQLGWIGGMIVPHPFLFEGNEQSRERALKNFVFFFDKTQTTSGFFYGMSDGENFYGDGFFKPHAKNWLLIRRNSDALYFVLKQFLLLERQNYSEMISEKWKLGIRRLCDAFLKLWNKYCQFGQFIDIETGKIVVGGSTSASLVPAGLALASRYFDESKYLKVAIASAQAYYDKYVLSGFTTGGPGEACQCPDSESAFGLLESFIVLYEITIDKKWLKAAVDMANQCATWCVSYDFKFPKESLFGKLEMKTAGSVWANVQNKHSAPGICTLSGDSLFKLFRYTGNKVYLDIIQQMARNLVQYISRADRPIGKMPPGWMTERVNLSDWAEGIGEIFEGSCWPEVSNMLSYVELPGLYIQPDTALICAIDNIEAELVSNTEDEITINLNNPTDFDANVKLWIENSNETSEVLGQNYLFGCQRIKIPSKSELVLKVDKKNKCSNIE